MGDLFRRNKMLVGFLAITVICLFLVLFISWGYFSGRTANGWFTLVESAQNAAGALSFEPIVSISDLSESGMSDDWVILYSILILVIPFMAASFFMSAFVRILYHFRLQTNKRKRKPIVVFGYNSLTRHFLDDFIVSAEKKDTDPEKSDNTDYRSDHDPESESETESEYGPDDRNHKQRELAKRESKGSLNHTGEAKEIVGSTARSIHRTASDPKEKAADYCIFLVTEEEIEEEKKAYYSQNHIFVFPEEFVDDDSFERFSKKIRLSEASTILLFHDAGLSNFSILSLLKDLKKKKRKKNSIAIKEDAKIFIRCEEDGLRAQISSDPAFQDIPAYERKKNAVNQAEEKGRENQTETKNKDNGKRAGAKGNNTDEPLLDIHIFSQEEQRARNLMKDLVSVLTENHSLSTDKQSWNLHHFIIGLTPMTLEMICQLIQNSIISVDNEIHFTIVDDDIEKAKQSFLSRFRTDVLFEPSNNILCFNPDYMDGTVIFEFVGSALVPNGIEKLLFQQKEKVHTIFIDTGIAETDLLTAYRIRGMREQSVALNQTLIYLPDEEKAVQNLLATPQKGDNRDQRIEDFYKPIRLVPGIDKTLSFEYIINQDRYEAAQKHDQRYREISVEEPILTYSSVTARKTMSALKWESNIALENHRPNKDLLLKALTENSALSKEDILWQMACTDGLFYQKPVENAESGSQTSDFKWQTVPDFTDRLRVFPEAYEIGAAEHRRWCAFYLCRGWGYRECPKVLQDLEMNHDCLRNFEWMIQYKQEKVPYDLLYLTNLMDQELDKPSF